MIMTRHAKKLDQMSKNKKKKTLETDLQLIQILELSSRDLKIAMANMFKKEDVGNFTRGLEYILKNQMEIYN